MIGNFLSFSIWRYLGILAIQALMFKQISTGMGPYFNIFLYPLVIFLLPLGLLQAYVVVLGFAIGLSVDFIYGSIGVHAGAGAFSAFMRYIILFSYMPKGGFTGKEPIFSPAHFGWQSFLQTVSLFFALHLFWYFSLDAFTPVYLGSITGKTLASWGLSMIFVVLFTVVFNPKRS